jgi:hypothetical protein
MDKEYIQKLKAGCRTKAACQSENISASSKNLFEREWEVFVVKKDQTTGTLIGKFACCALSPV